MDLQFLSGNPPGPVPDTSGPLTNSPFYEYVTTGHCSHVCVYNLSVSQILMSLDYF